MHDAPFLLAGLAARGVSVELDGETLRYRARDRLSAADRETLKARKPQIVDYLRIRDQAARRLDLRACGEGPIPTSLIQKVWVRLMGAPHAPGMEKLPLVMSFRDVAAADAEAAVRGLFARHDALRARLGDDQGMTVLLNPPEALEVVRERCAGQAEFDAAVARVVDQPLPLTGDVLVRAGVLEREDGTVAIVLMFHHFVADGASLGVIVREICARLAGQATREPLARYADYARAEARWFDSEAGAALARYTADRVAAIPPLRGPSGRELTWLAGDKTYRPLDLAPEISGRIAQAAARLRTTAFVVIATAYALALARWSGQTRFAIRVVGDQRTSYELAELVGMMTVTDILDIRLTEDLTELLGRVAAESESAMAIRLPAQPGPDGWHDWREQTGATINYTPYVPPEPPPAGLTFAAAPCLVAAAETRVKSGPVPAAPVFLRLIEDEKGLGGQFEFNEPLVSRDEQAAMVRALREALEEVIASAA